MYTICVAALKGGVGKTTTATNIAYLLSKSNRVLFADADCQGDSSKVFGAYSASFGGMAKLMQNGISVSDDITVDDYCRTPKSGSLTVLPANEWLQKTNAELMLERKMNQINILQKALDSVQEDYDYCVIDCGLQLDLTVVNAIMASDLVLSPMRLGGFELAALTRLQEHNAQSMIASEDTIEDSTQSLLPFEDVRDSMIHLGNHQYRAILSCSSLNYGLKTEKEQDIIELSFQRFLNSLSFPISIYVQTRTMENERMLESLRKDTLSILEEFPKLEAYGDAYFGEMADIYETIGNNKEKRKYVIIPFDEAATLTTSTDEEKYEYVLQEMKNRIIIIKDGLEAIGITAKLLNTNDLLDLLYVSYHKDTANQSENLVNHEFLDMIVSGDNKLQDLPDDAKLDFILYQAQTRLQTELIEVKDTNPKVAKKAEVGIKNINVIRKKIGGYFKDNSISNE